MAGEVSSGSAPTRDPLDEAVRLHERAVAARDAGRLAEAEELATKSLHIFEAEAGPDNPVNPDVANVLLCLAGVHDDRADYVGAEPLYRRAADTVAKLPESDPGEVELQRLRMQAVGGLGTVLRILGRYGEAEPLLKRAASEESIPAPGSVRVTVWKRERRVRRADDRLQGPPARRRGRGSVPGLVQGGAVGAAPAARAAWAARRLLIVEMTIRC